VLFKASRRPSTVSSTLAEAAASATAAVKPDTSLEKVVMVLAENCEVAERNTEQIRRLADQLTTHQSVNVIDNVTGTTTRLRPLERRSAVQRGQRWRMTTATTMDWTDQRNDDGRCDIGSKAEHDEPTPQLRR